MLSLVFGRDHLKTSEYLYSEIMRFLEKNENCILITPESATLQTEQKLFSRCSPKVNLNFEVLNFSRLPERVQREVGGVGFDPLNEGGRAILTALSLETVYPFLTDYKSVSGREEFLREICSEISRFKSMGISHDQLSAASVRAKSKGFERLSSKLHDIALIYSAYEASLGNMVNDAPDMLTSAAKRLRETEFISDYRIFIDGFSGFTGQEYDIISTMIKKAREVYVSVPCEEDGDGEINEKPLSAVLNLKRICAESRSQFRILRVPRDEEGGLSHLRESLWDSPAPTVKTDAVKIYHCKGKAGELEAAARIVLELCAERGYRMRDIAVCAADPLSYSGIAEHVFAKHGIPLYLSAKSCAADSSLWRLVESSYAAVCGGYRHEDMQRLIKTGLTALPSELADNLSLYAATWKISGKIWETDGDFNYNADGFSQRSSHRGTTIQERANKAKPILMKPLCAFKERIRENTTAKDHSDALYDYLAELSAETALEKRAEELREMGKSHAADCTRQIWQTLLSCMEQCIKLCTEKELSAKEYLYLLSVAMKNSDLAAIPGYADQVQLLPTTQLSGYAPKQLIILGANEGVFPRPKSRDRFFSSAEMKLLPECEIDFVNDSELYDCEELREFYSAVTLASDGLFVLYDDSAPCSVGVTRIEKLCEAEPLDARSISYTGTEAAAREYFRTESEEIRRDIGEKLPDEMLRRFRAFETLLEGKSKVDITTARKYIGTDMTMSPSRAEDYVNCPYRYWAKHVLGLREEKVAKMGANDVGSHAHGILESFVLDMICSGRDPATVKDEELCETVRVYVERYARDYLGGLDDKSPRFKYLLARLEGNVIAFMKKLRFEFSKSDFKPFKAEYKIGRHNSADSVKGLTVKLSEGETLTVSGIVDRVDVFEKDGKSYIRIVDYKTGNKELSVEGIKEGVNLQMLLYLFSICENGKELFSGEPVPAGAAYYLVGRPQIKLEAAELDSEISEKELIDAYDVSGIYVNDEAVLAALDKDGSCGLIKVDRQKNPKNLLSPEDFDALVGDITQTLRKIGDGLRNGESAPEPHCSKGKYPCRYCEYRNMCFSAKE